MNEISADRVLIAIGSKYIALDDADKHEYMQHYMHALESIIEGLKKEDELFNEIFQRNYFAGSYFDGLKISKPEEYDVDLVMKLPIDYQEVMVTNKGVTPPFVKVKLTGLKNLEGHPKYNVYRQMESWVDENGFILQSKFRSWMESAVSKMTAKWTPSNSVDVYLYSTKKSGPATTFHVQVPIKFSSNRQPRIEIDIDLVPVLEFKPSEWPPVPVRRNPFPKDLEEKQTFFVVPKPNSKNAAEVDETFWRFAFHNQEKNMLNNKNNLKPVFRLIKKLRDVAGLQNSIASYYIKTMFLWEVQKRPASYWSDTSPNVMFMDMLAVLRDCFKTGEIKNFWDQRADVLAGMSREERLNIAGRLENIINDIISKKGDGFPTIFAKYLLTDDELERFKREAPNNF